MKDKLYNSVRNIMHTYSHAPLADGQINYDQATARSGHTVYSRDIRANDIPAILSISDRDRFYLEETLNGIAVKQEYSDVIKFVEEGLIRAIPHTNNEAFIVVDASNNPITGWIDPADKPVNQYTLANGYEIRLKAGDKYVSRNYGWSFDAFNGILKFSGKLKPGTPEWEREFGCDGAIVEGFIYVGSTLQNDSNAIKEEIEQTKERFTSEFAGTLIIQPFRFDSSIMVKIGDPYPKKYTNVQPEKNVYFQTLSFVVPGFCFQISSLDDDETIITEMRHLPNGDTQIFIDVPWDLRYDRPIVRYMWNSTIEEVGVQYPVLGIYKFIASSFLRADGHNIPVTNIIDFNANPQGILPIPSSYEYIDSNPGAGEQVSPYPVGSPYNIDLDAPPVPGI